MAALLLGLSVNGLATPEVEQETEESSRVFSDLVLLSAVITTASPILLTQLTFVLSTQIKKSSMRMTEFFERISYNISVKDNIDEREILALRDEAIDYLSDGVESKRFRFFADHLQQTDTGRGMSDDQVATLVIVLGEYL